MTLLEQANKFLAEQQIETPYEVHDELPSLLTAFAESVMPKWTYLPELPAVKGWYDVTTTKTGARIVIQSFFNGKEFEDRCIVAWMPLPEPAK